MNVDIRYLGFRATEELKGRAEYRFGALFKEIAGSIDHMTIRLIDMCRGRNDCDKMCRVFLRLKSGQTLFVEESRHNLIELIDVVSDKVVSAASVMVGVRQSLKKGSGKGRLG